MLVSTLMPLQRLQSSMAARRFLLGLLPPGANAEVSLRDAAAVRSLCAESYTVGFCQAV